MRRAFLVLATAALSVSCAPDRLVSAADHTLGTRAADVPSLAWERSTTNVPMFVMGQFNGLNVIPLDVNDAGQIVGILRSPQPPFGVPDRAFLWENGTFTDFGPGTSPATVARAINTSGLIVGSSGVSAVTWTGTTKTALPGSANGAIAFGVNDGGDIVGADFVSASRWTGGVRSTLPLPASGTGTAFDINNNGLVAGRLTAFSPPFGRPLLWQNGVVTSVPMPTGYTLTNPHPFQSRVLNDAGEYIGNLQTGGTTRGVRRRAGTFEFLPVLSSGSQSFAIGIGEGGEIVGASPFESGPMHAVIWSTDNVIRDLGTVPGANSSTANAVNRNGWAVGTSVSVVDGVAKTVGVIWRVAGDDTPPEIAATVEGTLGSNGWYTSDVRITWSVTDGESEVSTQDGCETQNLVADTPDVTYTCTATNSAGLSAANSVTVKRDASSPVIAATVEGTLGSNGWYTSDVRVTSAVTDGQSEIASSSGCEVQNLVGDTPTVTYTCSATNGAGLSSTNSVTMKRDATAPVVTFSAHPATYDIFEHVSILCTASDAMSGLATQTCVDIDADAYRLGVGNYERTAGATDNAGNSSTVSTSFAIRVTLAGLATLTRQLVSDPGVANALCQKLDAAAAAMARGNDRVVQNLLDAFAQQVSAQSGKKIPAGDAQILIGLSDAIE